MTKQKQEQLMLMAITFAALGLGGYHLVIKQGLANLKKANAEIETKRDTILEMEGNIAKIPSLALQCASNSMVVAAAEAQLVGGGKYDDFLGIINSCATNTGMPVAQQQLREDLGDIKRGTYYVEKWVTIGTRAQYHSIGKWLAQIESSPYVRIVNFQVNSMESDQGFHPASLTISFLVKQGAQ